MNRLRRWSVSVTRISTIGNQLGGRFAWQSRNYQSIRRFTSERRELDYNIILPAEPFVFGVDYIQPRVVPDHIARPPYACGTNKLDPTVEFENPLQDSDGSGKIKLGGQAELKIRQAALLAKKVREFASSQVKVMYFVHERVLVSVKLVFFLNSFFFNFGQAGVTTNAIDAAIHDFIISHSAYPSPLLYSGFPRSCCTRYGHLPFPKVGS